MPELLSRRDIDFLLYEWLDVESLTQRERFAEHSRETFDAVLDLSTDIATRCFATHNKKSDVHEPQMLPGGAVALIPEIKTALDTYAASGLIAGEFDEAVGGMQLPTTVARASMAFFQAANAGTANYPFLTIANAHLIATYGTDEQVDSYVRPMLQGRYFGTMCLSEPQAGSSLADITTRAARQPDGSYRINGTKMWISGGDHDLSENIVHLVLAKTPGGGRGVKSISLFIVPKYLPADPACGESDVRNDVALSGLNHKMGNRGTTNTVLSFGGGSYNPGPEPGAVGYLVGEENCGLTYMFHMMNEARIGVGFLAHRPGLRRLPQVGRHMPTLACRAAHQTTRGTRRGPCRDHRTCRRPANAVGAEGLCRRGFSAWTVLFPARRRTGQRFGSDGRAGGRIAVGYFDARRQELAIPMVLTRQ